jgi:hypothetical protein
LQPKKHQVESIACFLAHQQNKSLHVAEVVITNTVVLSAAILKQFT